MLAFAHRLYEVFEEVLERQKEPETTLVTLILLKEQFIENLSDDIMIMIMAREEAMVHLQLSFVDIQDLCIGRGVRERLKNLYMGRAKEGQTKRTKKRVERKEG